jgi:hypothetical protein
MVRLVAAALVRGVRTSADDRPRTLRPVAPPIRKRCFQAVFRERAGWHEACHISCKTPHSKEIVMKLETLLLNSLFAACMVLCASTLGAMLV